MAECQLRLQFKSALAPAKMRRIGAVETTGAGGLDSDNSIATRAIRGNFIVTDVKDRFPREKGKG